MFDLHQISERAFANIALSNMVRIIGIETTNKRKAVTKKSTYKRTFLTAADIKIFVLVHFLVHSGTGIARYVITKEIAEAIGVHYKTVLASYNRLVNMGLLTVSAIDSDSNDVMQIGIVDYDSMFAKRGDGGNGYFVMSMDYLQAVLGAQTINELRVLLRMTAQTATDELNSSIKEATSLLSYKDLRRGLPAYVKPNVIRHAMDYAKNVFDGIDYVGKRIKATLRSDYQGKNVKKQIHNEAKNEINALIRGLNMAVSEANMEINSCKQAILRNGRFVLSDKAVQSFTNLGIRIDDWRYEVTESEFWSLIRNTNNQTPAAFYDQDEKEDQFYHSLEKVPELTLSQGDIQDCLLLAQDYGVKAVIRTIKDYYMTYIAGDIELPNIGKSLGALFRTMLRQEKVFAAII